MDDIDEMHSSSFIIIFESILKFKPLVIYSRYDYIARKCEKVFQQYFLIGQLIDARQGRSNIDRLESC